VALRKEKPVKKAEAWVRARLAPVQAMFGPSA